MKINKTAFIGTFLFALILLENFNAVNFGDLIALKNKKTSAYLSANTLSLAPSASGLVASTTDPKGSAQLGQWVALKVPAANATGFNWAGGTIAQGNSFLLQNAANGTFLTPDASVSTVSRNLKLQFGNTNANALTAEQLDATTLVVSSTDGSSNKSILVHQDGALKFVPAASVNLATADEAKFTIETKQVSYYDQSNTANAQKIATLITKHDPKFRFLAQNQYKGTLEALNGSELSSICACKTPEGVTKLFGVRASDSRVVTLTLKPDSTSSPVVSCFGITSVDNNVDAGQNLPAFADKVACAGDGKLLALDLVARNTNGQAASANQNLLTLDWKSIGTASALWKFEQKSVTDVACGSTYVALIQNKGEVWLKKDAEQSFKKVDLPFDAVALAMADDGAYWVVSSDGDVHSMPAGGYIYGTDGKKVFTKTDATGLATKIAVAGLGETNICVIATSTGKVYLSKNKGEFVALDLPVVQDIALTEDGFLYLIVKLPAGNYGYLSSVALRRLTGTDAENKAWDDASRVAVAAPYSKDTAAKFAGVFLRGGDKFLTPGADGKAVTSAVQDFTNYFDLDAVDELGQYRITMKDKFLAVKKEASGTLTPVFVSELTSAHSDIFFVYGTAAALKIRYLDKYLAVDASGNVVIQVAEYSWNAASSDNERMAAAVEALRQIGLQQAEFEKAQKIAFDAIAVQVNAVKQQMIKEKLDGEKAKLQSQIDALLAKAASLQKDLADARAKQAAAQAKIDASTREHEAQQAALKEKIAAMQTQMDNETDPTKKAVLKTQLDKLKAAGDNLMNVMFDNAKIIADQNNQYAEMAKRKATLEAQIASGEKEAAAQVDAMKAMYSGDLDSMLAQAVQTRFDKIARALGTSKTALLAKFATAQSITTLEDMATKLGLNVQDINKTLFVTYNVDQLVKNIVAACYNKIADAMSIPVADLTAKMQPGTEVNAADWDGLATFLGKPKATLQTKIAASYAVASADLALPLLVADLKLLSRTDNKDSASVVSAAKADVAAKNYTESKKIFGYFADQAADLVAQVASYDVVVQMRSDYASALAIGSMSSAAVVSDFKDDVTAFASALGSTYNAIVEAVTKDVAAIAKASGKDEATVKEKMASGFAKTAATFGPNWTSDSALISKIVGYGLMEAKYKEEIAAMLAKKAAVRETYLAAVTENERLRGELVKFLDERAAEQSLIDAKIIALRRKLADAGSSFDMQAFVDQVDALKSNNSEIMAKLHENEAKIFQKRVEITKQEQQITSLTDTLSAIVAAQEQFIKDATAESDAAKIDLSVVLSKYTIADRVAALNEIMEQAWLDARNVEIAKMIKTQAKHAVKLELVNEMLNLDKVKALVGELNSSASTESQKAQKIAALKSEISSVNRATLSHYASDVDDGENLLKIILKQLGVEQVKAHANAIVSIVQELEKQVFELVNVCNSVEIVNRIDQCVKTSLTSAVLWADKPKSTYLADLLTKLNTDLTTAKSADLPVVAQAVRSALEKFYLSAFDYGQIVAQESQESLEALGLAYLTNTFADSYLKALSSTDASGVVSTNLNNAVQNFIMPVVQFEKASQSKVAVFEKMPDAFGKLVTDFALKSLTAFKSALALNIDFYKVLAQAAISEFEIDKRINVTAQGLEAKRNDLIALQNSVLNYRTELMNQIQAKGTALVTAFEKAKAVFVEKRLATENDKKTLLANHNTFLAKAATDVAVTAEQKDQEARDYKSKVAQDDLIINDCSVREAILGANVSQVQTLLTQKQKELLALISATNEKQKSQMYLSVVEASEEQKIAAAKRVAEIEARNKAAMATLQLVLDKNIADAQARNKAYLETQSAQEQEWRKKLEEINNFNALQAAAAQKAQDMEAETKKLYMAYLASVQSLTDQKLRALRTIGSSFENEVVAVPTNFDASVESLVNNLKIALPTIPLIYPVLGLETTASLSVEQINNNIIASVVDAVNLSGPGGLPVVIGVATPKDNNKFAYVEKSPSGFFVRSGANIFDNLKFKFIKRGQVVSSTNLQKLPVTIQSLDDSVALTLVKSNRVFVDNPLPAQGFVPSDLNSFVISEDKADSLVVKSNKFESITFTLRKVVDFKEPNNIEAHAYYLVPLQSNTVTIANDLSTIKLSLKKIDDKTVWFKDASETLTKVQGADVPAVAALKVSDTQKSFVMSSLNASSVGNSQLFTIQEAGQTFVLRNELEGDLVAVTGTIGTAQVATSAQIAPTNNAELAQKFNAFRVPVLTFEQEFAQLTSMDNPNSIKNRFDEFKKSMTSEQMKAKFQEFKNILDGIQAKIISASSGFTSAMPKLGSTEVLSTIEGVLSSKIAAMDAILSDLSKVTKSDDGSILSTSIDIYDSATGNWIKEKIEADIKKAQAAGTAVIKDDAKMKLFDSINEYANQVIKGAQIIKEQCQRILNLRKIYVQTTVEKNQNIGDLEVNSVTQKFAWARNIYLSSQNQMDVSERAKLDFEAEMNKEVELQKQAMDTLNAQRVAAVASQKQAMADKQAAAEKAAQELQKMKEEEAKVFAQRMVQLQKEFDATKAQMSAAELAERAARLKDANDRFKMESDNLNKKLKDQKALIEAETARLKALAEGKTSAMEVQIRSAQQALLTYKVDSGTVVSISYQPDKNTEVSYVKNSADSKVPSTVDGVFVAELSNKATRFDANVKFKLVAQASGAFTFESIDGTKRLATVVKKNSKEEDDLEVVLVAPENKPPRIDASAEEKAKPNAVDNQSFFVEGSDQDGVIIRDFNKTGFLTVDKSNDPKKAVTLLFTTLSNQLKGSSATAVETKFEFIKTSPKSNTVDELLGGYIDNKDKKASLEGIVKAEEFFNKNRLYDFPYMLDNFIESVVEFGKGRMAKGLMTEAAVKKSNDLLDSINKRFMYKVSDEGAITVDKDAVKLMDKSFVEPVSLSNDQVVSIGYNSQFVSNKPENGSKVKFVSSGTYSKNHFFRVKFAENASSFSLETFDGKKRLVINGDQVLFDDTVNPAGDNGLFIVSGTRFSADISGQSKKFARTQDADNNAFLVAQDVGPEGGFALLVFNKNSFQEYLILNGIDLYDGKQESRVVIDKITGKIISLLEDKTLESEDKQALLSTFINYLQNYVNQQSMPIFAAAVAKVSYVAQKEVKDLDGAILAKMAEATSSISLDDKVYVSLKSNTNDKYCAVGPDGQVVPSDNNNGKESVFRIVKVQDKYAFIGNLGQGGYLTYREDKVTVGKDAVLDKDGKPTKVPEKNQLFSLIGNSVNLLIKSASTAVTDDVGFLGMHENNVLTFWDLFVPAKKPPFNSADARTKFTVELVDPNSVKFALVQGALDTLPRILLESMLDLVDNAKLSEDKKSLKAEQILRDFERSIFNKEVVAATDKTKKPVIKYSLKNNFLALQAITTDQDKDLYSFDDAFQNIKTHVLYNRSTKSGIKLSPDMQLVFDTLLTSFSSAGRSQKLITNSTIDQLVNPRGVDMTKDLKKDYVGEALDIFAQGKTSSVEIMAVVYAYVLRLARHVYGQGYIDNSMNFNYNKDGQGKLIDDKQVEYKLNTSGKFVSADGKEFAQQAPVLNADGQPTGKTQSFNPGIEIKQVSTGVFELVFKGDQSKFQVDPAMTQEYKARLDSALEKFVSGGSTALKVFGNLKDFLLKLQAQLGASTFVQFKEILLKDYKDSKNPAALTAEFEKLLGKISYRMPFESIEWKRDLAVVLYELAGKKAVFTLGADKNYTVSIQDSGKAIFTSPALDKVLAVLTKDVTAIVLQDGQMSITQKYDEFLQKIIDTWISGDKNKANTLLKTFKDDKLPKDWDVKTSPPSWWLGGIRPVPNDGSEAAKLANDSQRKRAWFEKSSQYLIRLLTAEQMQKRAKLMSFISKTPQYKKSAPKPFASAKASTSAQATVDRSAEKPATTPASGPAAKPAAAANLSQVVPVAQSGAAKISANVTQQAPVAAA